MSRSVVAFLLVVCAFMTPAGRAQNPRRFSDERGSAAEGGSGEQEAAQVGGQAAEREEELETDRDSFTPATSLVGRHRTVVESAYTFIDNRHVPETHSLPELIVRRGVSDWLELRFGTNYEVGGAGNPTSANVPDDLADEPELEKEASVAYGAKLALTGQSDWLPRSALMLQGFTPTAGQATDTQFVATYVGGWKFTNNCIWNSAIRYSTGSLEEDHFNDWSPSTVLKVPVGERWQTHLEYFGIFSDGRARESVQHLISPGAHYLISPNWEMGVRTGWGLNDQAPNFFANVGGGYRF